MRIPLIFSATILLFSCAPHTAIDYEAAREEVLDKGADIVQALNTTDLETLSRDFNRY